MYSVRQWSVMLMTVSVLAAGGCASGDKRPRSPFLHASCPSEREAPTRATWFVLGTGEADDHPWMEDCTYRALTDEDACRQVRDWILEHLQPLVDGDVRPKLALAGCGVRLYALHHQVALRGYYVMNALPDAGPREIRTWKPNIHQDDIIELITIYNEHGTPTDWTPNP